MNFNRIQATEVKLWDFSAYFWNTPRIVNTGEIWDWYIKTINHGNFSIKSYVLAISFGGDSNRSPHVILWRTSGIYAKSSFNSGLL